MLAYKACDTIIDLDKFREFFIIDRVDSYEDTSYYVQMRFYNLVLICESNLKTSLKILKTIPKNNTTPIVIFTDNLSKEFELQSLKNGALHVIKTPWENDLVIARLETIYRKKFQYFIPVGDYFVLDVAFKEVFDFGKKLINIKGKGFDILNYLVQFSHRRVTKEELTQAVWNEPELVRENLLEVHICILRNELKKHFSFECIDNKKRKGYKFLL